jgi:oligopeptidase B
MVRTLRTCTCILFLLMTTNAFLTAASPVDATAPQPPVAKKQPKVTEIHGQKLVDDYFWLRDKQNPDVKAYLEAENAYADAYMKPTEAFQQKLYGEMLSRIKQTDVAVPYRDGDYFYYSRTIEGKQYPILARKKGSLEAPEQVILDVNELAKGQSFMSLGALTVTDDGNLLAYTTDNTGFRQYTLHIRDLRTGSDLPDHAEKVGSVAWASDNKTVFYTVEDAAKRQYRLYRHTAAAAGADPLVYEEKDELFEVGVGKTRSRQYLLMEISSHTTSEFRYLAANSPTADWKIVEPRHHEVEYDVDHHGDSFFIRVNDTGRTFRLVQAPVADPGKKNWKEVLPARADVMLENVDFFKNFYVLHERAQGLQTLTVVDFASPGGKGIKFPEPAYTLGSENNRQWDTDKFRYRYTSFITPNSVYDYDVKTGESTLLKRTEVLGGYEPAKYTVERVYATAADGVKVPISLLYLKTLKKDGTAPIFLYAYGSYGIPTNAGFSSNVFSLVDRGVVYAIAHIRGGGDLGKPWHDDGKMMKKRNTFTDFISSAEYLVAQKYGTKDKLVIMGGSAGGLLMGAVTNMRPDLFHAVISKVPFVDVINTMLDESLPLTVGEFEEWGNPKEKPAFDYMYSYSPYDQLHKAAYPTILVKTSFNDSQVMYWEPAKYVAKLRTLKTDNNPLLLKTNMGAGHGGASGRYDFLKEIAFDYAFTLKEMGIDK